MEYQKVFVGKSQFRLKVLSVFAGLGTAASRGGGLKGRRQQSLVDIRPVWRQGRAASLNTTLVLSNCDIDDTPLGLHWDCLQCFSMMCGFKDLCYIQNCLTFKRNRGAAGRQLHLLSLFLRDTSGRN